MDDLRNRKNNSISYLKTEETETETSIQHSIVMGLELYDKSSLERFILQAIEDVITQFKCSPPETTTYFLITIIGEISAREFEELWNKNIRTNQVIQVFWSKLEVAYVIYNAEEGTIIEQISLLNTS